MTAPQAKTLQIFLPTGEPRGVRIAEITTRIAQAVLIPRSDLAVAKKRPELDQLGIYFLFGESDDQAKPIAYIGQTENPRQRLDIHNSKKDFWTTAILVISRTNSFTNTHIIFLEWYCVQRAKEVGRYQLDNDQEPTKPFVPEHLEADALDSFDTLNTLVSALGYPIFETLASKEASEQLFLKGKNAEATGELVEDGFVVRAGATARKEIVASATDSVTPMRAKLIESGVMAEENGQYRFTQDYLFNSPSGAAAVVLGRTSNGWVDWKNAEGKTLHDAKRAESGESEC